MRLFKRKVNPIFVEDEQYNWGEKRTGMKVLLLVMASGTLVGLVLLLLAWPV